MSKYQKIGKNDGREDLLFYPNTSIGGIDVSNMTLSEAKNAVQTDLKNHVLVIKGRNNAKYELRGADIDLNANYEKQVEDCFKKTHGLFSFYKIILGEDFDVNFDVSYNKEAFKNNLSQSNTSRTSVRLGDQIARKIFQTRSTYFNLDDIA